MWALYGQCKHVTEMEILTIQKLLQSGSDMLTICTYNVVVLFELNSVNVSFNIFSFVAFLGMSYLSQDKTQFKIRFIILLSK